MTESEYAVLVQELDKIDNSVIEINARAEHTAECSRIRDSAALVRGILKSAMNEERMRNMQ